MLHDRATLPLTSGPEGSLPSQAAYDVIAERRRQVGVEGWTPEHDDTHRDGEMANAAASYAAGGGLFKVTSLQVPRQVWPYRWEWNPKDRRRDLVRAAALIIAEIERLDRHEERRRAVAAHSRLPTAPPSPALRAPGALALMAVYVDDVRHRFGNMVMCHLWADTEAELLAMVDTIGVARRWIQRPPKASWVHFDIGLGAKARAVQAGAVLTDVFGPLEHAARLDVASGNPQRVARGTSRLESIAHSRTLRSG